MALPWGLAVGCIDGRPASVVFLRALLAERACVSAGYTGAVSGRLNGDTVGLPVVSSA